MDFPGGGEVGVLCSLHGKQRSLLSLTEDGCGGLRCRPGMDCKGGGAGNFMQALPGMGAGVGGGCGNFGGGGGGGGFGNRLFCSIHGKQRNQLSLSDDGLGGFRCVQGMECKTSVTGTTCSLHGKMRGMESLVDDGVGGYRCIPGKECKDGLAIKRELCKFWLQGICNKGMACTFLHGPDDQGSPQGLESDDGMMTMGQGPGMMMPNGMVLGSEGHQVHMRTRQEAAFNVGMAPTEWNGFEVMMFPKGDHRDKQAKGSGRGSGSGYTPY